jgi:predicted O-methyltransferase YrrM
LNQALFRIRSYITYWLHAVDAHSLHSPFFYDFYTRVVRPSSSPYLLQQPDRALPAGHDIEDARRTLLHDHREIEVLDLGAGSKHARTPRRKISEIARHSLTGHRYAVLYQRAIAHYNATHVLELGTSLGINALYLASSPRVHLTTMEGSPEVAALAASLFNRTHSDNISLITGNIDDQLSGIVARMPRIDFAFLDANHRYTPTCQYFEILQAKLHARSIVVLDDIHNSHEMERAWHDIRKHPRVTASADLFRCGFVFFDPSLNSQHFVLQT